MKAVHLAAGIGSIAALGSVGAAAYLFNKTIPRGPALSVSKEPGLNASRWESYFPTIRKNKAWLDEQETKAVSVTTFDGLKLSGVILPAKVPSDTLIIGLHGYKSRGKNDFSSIARFYHEQGYHVLIVDHRAHGDSEGKYIGFGILDRIDCKEWIELGIRELGEDCNIYLHGISMGGATVLMRAGLGVPEQVKGVIADCAFTSPWDIFSHVLKKDYHQPKFPILYLANTFCKQIAKYRFDEVSNIEEVRKIKVPILFIHGEEDTFVPTYMSRQMYSICNQEKKLLLIPEAGHGECYYADTQAYQETVKHFLEKCSRKQVIESTK